MPGLYKCRYSGYNVMRVIEQNGWLYWDIAKDFGTDRWSPKLVKKSHIEKDWIRIGD